LASASQGRHVLPQVAHQDALDQGLGAAFEIPAKRHQAGTLADRQEALHHVGHGHLAEGLEGVVAGDGLARTCPHYRGNGISLGSGMIRLAAASSDWADTHKLALLPRA
jgi:hypothetical protein